MKSILTLVGGSDRDQIISQTALAAAQPLSAHLHFLHIHVSAGETARYNHAEFLRGAALRNCLDELQHNAQTFSNLAANHVHDFCARARIEICEAPGSAQNVTASFREEQNNAIERLTYYARHSDLIVIGRARQRQGLPPDTLERLILESGRPILIAAPAPPPKLTGTIMVCWKESHNAARAVTAATPILLKAKRVIFTTAVERKNEYLASAVSDLAERFAWNDVSTEVQIVPMNGRATSDVLSDAARNCDADVLVMGAYGHSRLRKTFFGSMTDELVRRSDTPIILVH